MCVTVFPTNHNGIIQTKRMFFVNQSLANPAKNFDQNLSSLQKTQICCKVVNIVLVQLGQEGTLNKIR
jgi:hypothetical protein